MNTYSLLLHLHSYVRWFLLIVLIIALVRAIMGLASKQSYKLLDAKLALYTMIFAHIQLLLGFALYVVSPSVQWSDMSVTMKDADLRFWTIEHLSIMLLAILLITLGRAFSRRAQAPDGKFKKILIYFGIALLAIIYGIPWSRVF
ncbi:MAG: hypothetical protein R2798_12930 [Chitinophagales bacterium]|nr:cytochrome B [Bacteroidota bacterium]MCB9042485.1 cytochrome B [Chitinophagales bacterium]